MASVSCIETGAVIDVTGPPGSEVDVFIDGAFDSVITIGPDGTASANVDQLPGATNLIEVRNGRDVLTSGSFSCVEGTSSPGDPDPTPGRTPGPGSGEPEVLGEVVPRELADTGGSPGFLPVIAGTLLLAGLMLTGAGVSLGRRTD